jgi:hypothetical protein
MIIKAFPMKLFLGGLVNIRLTITLPCDYDFIANGTSLFRCWLNLREGIDSLECVIDISKEIVQAPTYFKGYTPV